MKTRKILTVIMLLVVSMVVNATDFTDVKMTVDGMKVTLNNGKIIVTIGSNGRVSSLKFNQSRELLGSSGIYFDYTTAQGNKALSPSKMKVVKNTPDMCEVLYSSTSGNTIFEQGYIMRKNVAGLYTYVIATGTSTSANEPVKEARVCTRTASTLLQGYVDWRMNGRIPSNEEMGVAEREENTVQDATYKLADGSVYTKYNWANYVERDTIHGLSDNYFGIWNIPVSYEWLNGGVDRQELMVHATSKSPITIQMLQGEHLGGGAMVLGNGEKKLYGPFLIYTNLEVPKITGPIADAQKMAETQQAEWPFQWFDNELYPKVRGTVKGHLTVTTGQRNDSVRIVLAQEKGVEPIAQSRGYQFWTRTDGNGDFTIKNVRPGTYHLYAYATAGDVTDMLEKDDIVVTEGEQTLGDIVWTPTCYDNLLWMIGQNDRRSSEFNCSDDMRQYGEWEKSPESLTYVIGKSNPKTDWYYAQTKKGTWTIGFTLDKTYTGMACLTASLAGSTNAGASVAVKVNGTSRGTWKTGYNDAAIYRSAIQSGRHALVQTTFPASALKKGQNTIQLTMSGNGKNGGFMYDCIKLEAGSLVTAVKGVKDASESLDVAAVRKYMVNGQIFIVKGDKTYNVAGCPSDIFE